MPRSYGLGLARSPIHSDCPTPLEAAGRGLLAGLGASFLLSFLARILPGMENTPRALQSGAAATPADALAQPTAPGPEGLAEQFAFKIASGVFGVDLSPHARAAGIGTHLLYGSTWGMLYGLVQGTFRRPPTPTGALFGVVVWLAGPGLLVPAMRLMRAPHKEPPLRTGMLVAGHVAYGLTLASVYETLER